MNDELKLICAPEYNTYADDAVEDCAPTLRDPNAGTYDDDVDPNSTRISYSEDLAIRRAEGEAAEYADHCCDQDDAQGELFSDYDFSHVSDESPL